MKTHLTTSRKSRRRTLAVASRARLKFQAERKQLQKEILEISGREQQRIGQDLHDDLCQHLTAITLLTEILEKKLADKASAEAADAGEIHRLVTQAIVQTRSLAKGLLPMEVTPNGLLLALEDMAANTENSTRISCRAEGDIPVMIRDGTVAVHLYRIAQEAVANAVKHARAKHIVIALSGKNGYLFLSISDDGIGIPREALHNGGLGLSIIRSRTEAIGASLRIRQGDLGGTVVSCSLRSPADPVVKAAGLHPARKGRHGKFAAA